VKYKVEYFDIIEKELKKEGFSFFKKREARSFVNKQPDCTKEFYFEVDNVGGLRLEVFMSLMVEEVERVFTEITHIKSNSTIFSSLGVYRSCIDGIATVQNRVLIVIDQYSDFSKEIKNTITYFNEAKEYFEFYLNLENLHKHLNTEPRKTSGLIFLLSPRMKKGLIVAYLCRESESSLFYLKEEYRAELVAWNKPEMVEELEDFYRKFIEYINKN